MNATGYALVGLTAVVAALVGALAFAVFRFMAAARAARGRLAGRAETALMSSALQDAVTSLKAQERAMSARAEASERLSARVFESLTAGLIVVDAGGTVTIVNPAALRMLSIDAEPAGADYRALLAEAPPVVELIADALATGRAFDGRSVRVERAHRCWHFGVSVSPLAVPGQRPGAICLLSDITPIVELEEQLRTRAALAALGEMTAGLAHEFRNGLATIHGYVRLIDPQQVPPPYRPCVEGIRDETDTMGRVVTNFLSFARPETIARVQIELESVVRRAADEIRRELPETLALTVTGSFGAVAGDEVLLRQTFANLIRNAAEACAAAPAPAIVVAGTVDADAGVSVVTVDDNGPGIPDAHRARVFQPFFTTRSRGSGLGLSIVQKIVLLHNGKVAVGTAAGGGARVELTFPLPKAA